jgi:hypothetical protein
MSSILNATTSSGLVTSADNSGSLQLATNNGTTAVTIDTSQNVGIGTSSPASKLAILESTNGNSILNLRNTNAGSSATSILALGNDSALNAAYIVLNSSTNSSGGTGNSLNITNGLNAPMTFATNGTERMRINAGGEVQINTTSDLASTAFLQIAYDGGANNAMVIKNNGVYSSYTVNFLNSSSVSAGGIFMTGSNSVSYVTSSDYRLKEDIAPMTGALDKVSALKPVTYKWKSDGSTGQGFIAHELQAVVPDCVTGEKDAVETYTDEDGNEQTRPKYQGIDTSFLVATLTAAIQELNAKVEAQAVRIAELEGAK